MKRLNIILTLLLAGCGNRLYSVPCTTMQTTTGSTITCPDGSTATISNGTNGTPGGIGPQGSPGAQGNPGIQGVPGPMPSLGPDTPMWLIAPCGQNSSDFKEQIMCLNNGSLLASFSSDPSGTNTRFSLLPVGTYQDTDDSGCTFTVSLASDNASYVISWEAGSSSYGTWNAGDQTCLANQN